ncbi:MAG: ABC transporter ATP-binding protein [Bifidobacteriaceae bacterium]|jgi:peptide/nickel transport system ATP-binding protein|nr:ABC transporter ATP-binding protein [Bifidobacteriaceae bacterium]
MSTLKERKGQPLLTVRDLDVTFTAGYGKDKVTVHAVKKASFEIKAGERVAIVGESGSGKSTTAHALIDLLPGSGKVTGGSIDFVNRELVGAKSKLIEEIRGAGIGLVPQDPMSNLNPVHKIGKQVEEAIAANVTKTGEKKLSKAELKKRAAVALENAGLKDAFDRLKQYPHEFSGGMRQRVLIAIALANNPNLLIADEPTSALDVTVQKVILDHLDTMVEELGTAVLFITHDLGLAAERSEKLIVMYKGEIVESGPSLEILKNPVHPYTKKLIAAAPSIAATRIQSVKEFHHAAKQGGGLHGSADRRENLVEVRNLTRVFDIRGKKEKLTAVDNVTFDVPTGKTTAIVGESGSGKSTVANMILGLLGITNGDIYYDGQNMKEFINKQDLAKKFRSHVQVVFQNPYGSLDPMFSIGRAIEEPLQIHKIGTKEEQRKRMLELLDMVELPASVATRYPNELSGGQRQRIAIARALTLNPEMIVLDEAVSALDVLVQQQILMLLNDLQAELGLTYLFITHDLAVVRLVADNTVVMENGKIVEAGDTETVFNNPVQAYTKNLLDAIPGRNVLG